MKSTSRTSRAPGPRSLFGRACALLAISGVAIAAALSVGCPSEPVEGPARGPRQLITPAVAGGDDVAPVGPPPAGDAFAKGVTIRLEKVIGEPSVVSFGLPVSPAWVPDPAKVRVVAAGSTEPLRGVVVKPILSAYGKGGERVGIRSLVVQLPPAAMTGKTLDIEVVWSGTGGEPPGTAARPFADAKAPSPEVVEVADRAIRNEGGDYALVETRVEKRVLFQGSEPRVLAAYPPGYLAATGLFGALFTREQVAATPGLRGMAWLSDAFVKFTRSAVYADGFRPSAHPPSGNDPYSVAVPEIGKLYEAWLYDRCATFLLAYAHAGDVRMLRHGLRACSHYAEQIDPRGYFRGKPEPDTKYSHVRGVYAYYALTGDEVALEAGRRMASMWLNDAELVLPYRRGGARGPDKLWTERQLGTGLEALLYGFLMTGQRKYLAGFEEVLATAHEHLTTRDRARLSAISKTAFPPQNCFVHSKQQHEGFGPEDPWCSVWMTELLLDPLLAYQKMTGDARVDDMLVRLADFLRDVGTVYFKGDPQRDSFLSPSVCYDPDDGEGVRRLVPAYGAGLRADGSRFVHTEWDDFEHCADASALTAAALRALKRTGRWSAPGPAPFATEGDSILALHHELAACARLTFDYWSRERRNPAAWSGKELAEGFAGGDEKRQAEWIRKNKIGFPLYESMPLRKLSWWFNTPILQFAWLAEAGIPLAELRPGAVQKPGCQ